MNSLYTGLSRSIVHPRPKPKPMIPPLRSTAMETVFTAVICHRWRVMPVVVRPAEGEVVQCLMRLSDCQSVTRSDWRSVVDCQPVRLSYCQADRLTGCHTVILSYCHTDRLTDCQPLSLSDCQSISLSDCQTVIL